MSARSARKHKARGVSPGNLIARSLKPAERATESTVITNSFVSVCHPQSSRNEFDHFGTNLLSPAPRARHGLSTLPGAHAPGFTLSCAPRTLGSDLDSGFPTKRPGAAVNRMIRHRRSARSQPDPLPRESSLPTQGGAQRSCLTQLRFVSPAGIASELDLQ